MIKTYTVCSARNDTEMLGISGYAGEEEVHMEMIYPRCLLPLLSPHFPTRATGLSLYHSVETGTLKSSEILYWLHSVGQR